MVMRARRTSIIAVFFLLAAGARAAEPLHPSVSFLVCAKNPVRDISAGDLRRIFLGDISRWSNGHRIILFVRPAETQSGRTFLDRLVRMSDIDYSQWWLGAVFRGRAASAPRVIDTAEAMINAVAAVPDAIGFIGPHDIALQPGVAALTIDGKAPSDPEYPIRGR